ncbi:MAG: hypothetical protein HYV09_31975 [Deltaproteobacteria bacterium]|nr:hypothetical protein [Deltaproteobacteria bacterium]
MALAAYVTWIAVADFTRMELLSPMYQGRAVPLQGAARIAKSVDLALTLSWPWLFLACTLHYFAGRGARAVVALWAVVAALIVATRTNAPDARVFGAAYQAATSLCWLVILLAIVRRRGLEPTISHVVLLLYVAADLVAAAFPWVGVPQQISSSWDLVLTSSVMGAVAVILAHIVALLRMRSGATTIETAR